MQRRYISLSGLRFLYHRRKGRNSVNVVIDENVSFSVVEELRRKGHNVIAVCELAKVSLSDESVYEIMKKHNAILITRDHHFKNSLRFPTKGTDGIIYLREGNLTSDEETELVRRFFAKYEIEQIKERFVTLYKQGISIRKPQM